MSEDFIGKGWAFPIRADATGRIALVARDQELAESIRLILGTAKGERPMRPEFGCGIHDQIFSPMDATTAGRVAYDVQIRSRPLGAAYRCRFGRRQLRRKQVGRHVRRYPLHRKGDQRPAQPRVPVLRHT